MSILPIRALDRRTALTTLGAGLAVLAAGPRVSRASREARVFGALGGLEDGFWLTGVDERGGTLIRIPLPDRGHDTAIDPMARHAVIIARRPGRFAMVIDLASGTLEREIAAQLGRHFYGHGVFSADGALFYTTENDYDAGVGRIGVRDAEDGFRWLGELPAHGVGPHQLTLLSDGAALVVANGGIQTHPAEGRRKLNLETMAPSLVTLEAASGRLLKEQSLAPWLHQLSMRHIVRDSADRVAVVMQHEGAVGDRVPLVAVDRGDGALALLRAPEPVELRMRNYCGSVCLDSAERVLAVSHPRGGQVTFWSWPEGDYLSRINILDGCGLAPAGAPGRFLVSNGRGELFLHDAQAVDARPQRLAVFDQRYWDNHLTYLPGGS